MDNTEEKPKNNSRRAFIQNIGMAGIGGLALGGALFAGYHFQKGKDDQKVRLLTTDGRLVELDSLELKDVAKDALTEYQKRGREGIPGKKWVMIVDLAKCRNARKCIEACQGAHHLRPEQYHINTLQMQDNPNTAPYHLPKPCQHCDNPPCVSVCPVDATFKREDGPVLIDNERCIGCRFCIAACPYSARSFNWFDPKDAEKDMDLVYDIELNVPQKKGTITKCLFSADRLREGKLPYCVSACPNGVYWFGDQNEDAVTNGTTKETTRLSALLRDNGAYQLMEELGTKPRVYYLPPKERLFPYTDESQTTEDKAHV
jgi:molybdopterin-containing oxidoreductase family iron-sulfur binding subunit